LVRSPPEAQNRRKPAQEKPESRAVAGQEAPAAGEVTGLLRRWAAGEAAALDALWPMVYEDLRRLARRQLIRERGDHTLQGTALVNEAFIRLAGQSCIDWLNREQFLALAAKIMRHVLVDYARQRNAQRRGDGARKVSLSDTRAALEAEQVQAAAFAEDEVDVLAIDTALLRLEQFDAPQSRIVELRYFGGLTLEETASVTGISVASVKREWAMARAWLRRELGNA
jgi:RNA polymerase sigma factor (TIGR02999 family)